MSKAKQKKRIRDLQERAWRGDWKAVQRLEKLERKAFNADPYLYTYGRNV